MFSAVGAMYCHCSIGSRVTSRVCNGDGRYLKILLSGCLEFTSGVRGYSPQPEHIPRECLLLQDVSDGSVSAGRM